MSPETVPNMTTTSQQVILLPTTSITAPSKSVVRTDHPATTTCTPSNCHHHHHHHRPQLRSYFDQQQAQDATIYSRIPQTTSTTGPPHPNSRMSYYEAKAQEAINRFNSSFNNTGTQ
ncbi:hypothetical protein QBC43DRAFT_304624 [Cladorrhinum sp. PSN259]|nr:hypothetical protein QBC43DRAFT_304624 [Cladorrhinum sp. PSN259]